MKIFTFISEVIEFKLNKYVLIPVLIIIGLMIVLFFVDRYRYNQKIKKIINGYKGLEKEENVSIQKKKPTTKGWGMNDSPFRERKSSLTWGGGNIKGASAKRGTQKSFLK